MIFPRQFLANSTLHESRKRREDVDWWVNLSVVQVSVDNNLAFRDVTSQIGDGMCDV